MSRLLLVLAMAGCAAGPARSTRHPARWWAPVETPHSWEITPDRAAAGSVVLSKRNELGLLSNFAPTPFELDGVRYGSVEGFWQMMKYPEGPGDPRAALGTWPHTRAEVGAMTAFAARRAGKSASALLKAAGIGWISYRGEHFEPKGAGQATHEALIRRAMAAKLAANPDVAHALASTSGLALEPDHRQSPGKTPAYEYHRIWMELREDLEPPRGFLAGWSADSRSRLLAAAGAAMYAERPVAVFDGDGTLWQADLPREFLEDQIGKRLLRHFDYSGDDPVARLYGTCKHDVSICIGQAAWLHAGRDLEELAAQGEAFTASHLKGRVFGAQRALVSWLHARGFEVWVVSGGPELLAAQAASRWFGIPPERVIGVRTRVVEGVVSAEVVPPLPFRKGKAAAIAARIGATPHIVLGNSKSDAPMLSTATHLAVAVQSFESDHPGFHFASEQKLAAIAAKRGWLIQKLEP